MNVRNRGKQVTCRPLMGLFGMTAYFAVTAQPALTEEGPRVPTEPMQNGLSPSLAQPSAENSAAVPEAASGLRVYVDPQTGIVRPTPFPGSTTLQLTPTEQNALSTSHQGLVEVPSQVPGGGVVIDLQGRFQSPLIGTIDANGKVKMQHLGEPHEIRKSDDKK